VRFGKRVSYDSRVTQQEVMEEHLRQMRINLLNNQNHQSLKLKQEKEFLDQIKLLDEIEKSRKKETELAKIQDFKNSNLNINKEVQERKTKQKEDFVTARYNHFPFTSGELIEMHRLSLNSQLKNDYRAFMENNRNSKSITGRHKSNLMEHFSNTEFMNPEAYSTFTKSLANSQRKAMPRKLKSLFDSDYVKPEYNFRVKQDVDPNKVAAQ